MEEEKREGDDVIMNMMNLMNGREPSRGNDDHQHNSKGQSRSKKSL